MSSSLKARLRANFDETNARLDRALDEALRNRAGLTMVVVSRRQPLAAIKAAYALGVRHFGENQIQEATPKMGAAREGITWHFIGQMQKNKVRKTLKHFQYLHTIDSLSLLSRVDTLAGEERACPSVFLQVNFGKDPGKNGLYPEEVEPVLEAALDMKNVNCVGLMAIPPDSASKEQTIAYFEGVHAMRDSLKEAYPDWPGKLSLGMSADFELAIACGANFIRLGQSLFGER